MTKLARNASRERVPVLVIGGGPVGTAFAVDLAHRGHPPLVVEPQHEIPTSHPRGSNVSMRTVEHFRRWGIAEKLKAQATSVTTVDGKPYVHSRGERTIFADSIFGDVLGVFPFNYGRTEEQYRDIAAEPSVSVVQPRGHAVLRERALELGARFLNGFELVELHELADRVEARVRDVATGEERIIEADYVVGCDGAGSPTRKIVGIDRDGEGDTFIASCIVRLKEHTNTEILARMRYDLGGFLLIANDDILSNAAPFDETGWRFSVKPGHDGIVPPDEEIIEKAYAIFGERLPLELEPVNRYRRQIRIAQRYGTSRVFLAGDAAHLFPPVGGQNQNLGIGDAVNLAWKLAGVLEGWASTDILETYDAERRPIAWRVGRVAYGISDVWPDMIDAIRAAKVPGPVDDDAVRKRYALGEVLYKGTYAEWNTHGLVLDIRYEDTPIVVQDGTSVPEWSGSQFQPLARPGHRAPHFLLQDGTPVYDHFGPAFTLLVFGEEDALAASFVREAAAAGIPLTLLVLDSEQGKALYDASHILVRPDQQVVWRKGPKAADARDILAIATGRRIATSALRASA